MPVRSVFFHCFTVKKEETMSTSPLLTTDFEELTLIHRGKVRDLYEVEGQLLMVATDRISAYDVILNQLIPDKGRVLTAIKVEKKGRTREELDQVTCWLTGHDAASLAAALEDAAV